MVFGLINALKGNYTLKATGRFPERILNIASIKGIYIYDVRRGEDGTLSFSVSKKGAEKILSENIDGIEISLTQKSGLPVFLKRHSKRIALILLPVVFFIVTGVFSMFVWQIEIEGGDSRLQKQVREVLRENGIRPGTQKSKIDQYDIKRRAIMEIDDLSWLWMDIKGTSAKVKIRPRKNEPSLLKISEPADVISIHTGVIEKMQVYCGVPLLKEGMTAEKGQVVVTGVLKSENENIPTYYHHACADIFLRCSREKTYVIPKKTVEKKPTGNKKTVFSVNFKKNNINFSLNSGISYTNYDKIDKTVKLPFLPVSFSKVTYHEATVTMADTDIVESTHTHRQSFVSELERDGAEIIDIKEITEDTPDAVRVTFRGEYLIKADKEIPVTKGEQNGKIN